MAPVFFIIDSLLKECSVKITLGNFIDNSLSNVVVYLARVRRGEWHHQSMAFDDDLVKQLPLFCHDRRGASGALGVCWRCDAHPRPNRPSRPNCRADAGVDSSGADAFRGALEDDWPSGLG